MRRFNVFTFVLLVASLATGGFMVPSNTGGVPSGEFLSNHPNILVFIADDAGWRDFGTYGNEAIRTPNIDRLAQSGLQVQKAFLTTAQCSPSRISILTGKYPHATGAEDLHVPLPENEQMVPAYLQEQDYFTGHMRKTHYGANGDEQFQWYSEDLSSAFPDFLNERGDRPFFLWVGFSDPHRPYSDETLENPHEPSEVAVPPYLADTPSTRADLARYYDEISRMDRQIGRFMDELKRRGIQENTLVVFLSDNGAPFPRAKTTVYDAGIRTPLIFSWPAQIKAGQVYDDGLVSVVDLAPTFLDLAGVEVSEKMQGESMAGLLEDPTSFDGRTYIFSERNWHDCDEHIRSVRTEHHKLILNEDYTELPLCMPAGASSPSWFSLKRLQEKGKLTHAQKRLFEVPRAAVELYNMQKDPWEVNNVADEAAYREIANRLSKVLEKWKNRTDDFPPTKRKRSDTMDRVTGVEWVEEVPPLRNNIK